MDDIYFKEVKATTYIFVNKFIKGQKTNELLPLFRDVIKGLTFPKTMRWGDLNLRYVRPIRWLVALYGTEIIPFEIAGVPTGKQTYGHRFLGSSLMLDDPKEYKERLKQQFVLVDPEEREQSILKGIKEVEEEYGWQVPMDTALFNEVTHLVEYPTVFTGSFNEEFLAIPEEALISSMKEHQRYFPVRNKDNQLLAHFVGVRNGNSDHLETVAKGNEKVLKARLSDARFFYEEDQKLSIEQSLQKLKRMVYQESLGTISDKVDRVVALTKEISGLLQVEEQTRNNAVRGAEISKFDLVTNMVNEFTDLQGVMGEKYAKLFGENEKVAKAINEHYMPRHAHDDLPETTEGAMVSIADKVDTIVGCISVGIIPTGSQDPYGLRRQALGVLQILRTRRWNADVETIWNSALELYRDSDVMKTGEKEIENEIDAFFKARASFILKEHAIDQDVIKAVLYKDIGNLSFTLDKAQLLTNKRHDENFRDTQEALVRVLNIADKGEDLGVNEDYFENESEKVLFNRFKEVAPAFQQAMEHQQSTEALRNLGKLAAPIHTFFEDTMVMTENEQIKNNRLSLLNKIARLIFQFGNLKAIEWKQQF